MAKPPAKLVWVTTNRLLVLVLTRFHGHKRALGFRTVRSSVPTRLSQKQGYPQVRSTRWVIRLRRRDSDLKRRRHYQRLVLLRVDSPHMLRDHVRAGDVLPLDRGAGLQVLGVLTLTVPE